MALCLGAIQFSKEEKYRQDYLSNKFVPELSDMTTQIDITVDNLTIVTHCAL